MSEECNFCGDTYDIMISITVWPKHSSDPEDGKICLKCLNEQLKKLD